MTWVVLMFTTEGFAFCAISEKDLGTNCATDGAAAALVSET
jgi:hypothetical protein